MIASLGLVSCHNFDTDFPDFDYTTGYFPYQFPVRTLVLGDYIFDNENDNAHKFVISAAMGGVYSNSKNRVFNIQVDESLCNNVGFSGGGAIKALPSTYYTLSNASQITIPSGSVNGGIDVQLNDAFFNDPDAIKNTYVVPIRMVSSNDVDSILVGDPAVANPDVRFESQWAITPKNFTMFGIKFINEWHGNYFHYGSSTTNGTAKAYKEIYVEYNAVCKLVTTGRNQVSLTRKLDSDSWAPEVTLLFNFSGDNCTITAPAGAGYTVSGQGTWNKDQGDYDSFGNKPRNVLSYSYTVSDGTNTYSAQDNLVARDRAVTLETYTPVAL